MSKAVKPSLLQNLQITAHGLAPKDWLVVSDDPEKMRLVHRGSGRSREIKKTQ